MKKKRAGFIILVLIIVVGIIFLIIPTKEKNFKKAIKALEEAGYTLNEDSYIKYNSDLTLDEYYDSKDNTKSVDMYTYNLKNLSLNHHTIEKNNSMTKNINLVYYLKNNVSTLSIEYKNKEEYIIQMIEYDYSTDTYNCNTSLSQNTEKDFCNDFEDELGSIKSEYLLLFDEYHVDLDLLKEYDYEGTPTPNV